jgi:hypothetical protein
MDVEDKIISVVVSAIAVEFSVQVLDAPSTQDVLNTGIDLSSSRFVCSCISRKTHHS